MRFAAFGYAAFLLTSAYAAALPFPHFFVTTVRRDIALDPVRDVLYISYGPQVRRYDLQTHQFLTSYDVGGDVYGIAVSPLGSHLIASDRTYRNGQDRITVVDLNDGSIFHVSRPVDPTSYYYTSATYSIASLDEDNFIVAGLGEPQINRYKVSDQSFNPLPGGLPYAAPSVRTNANGTAFAYVNGGIVSGSFGLVNTSTMEVRNASIPWFVFESAVNRFGNQVALPTYGGLFVYGGVNFSQQAYIEGHAIGAVFSPAAEVLFVAQPGVNAIVAYSAMTYAKIAVVEPNELWQGISGNSALVDGTMQMSQDGRRLFVTVPGGISVYDVSSLGVPEPSTLTLWTTFAIAQCGFKRRRF